MPSDIEKESAHALLETFKAGVRALGIDNGAAKGDIKLTPKGPMIGEIAARLSGGYMSGWTYPYASEVLPTKGAIQIALGQKPGGLEPKKNWTCAERAFISIPGTVRSISGLDKARSVPGFKDLFMRIHEGSRVVFPENNVTKCGNIISAAPVRATAVASAESAARSILIRLAAPDSATAAFLAGYRSKQDPRFPPEAFVLDTRLRNLLDALPDPAAMRRGEPGLVPFPEFTGSDLRDWAGRSVLESLTAVRLLTGLSLPPGGHGALGRSFWAALVRGGYQGGVYYIDTLGIGKN
jgi:hypothetical protein